MKIAGLMPTRNYRDDVKALAMLQHLTDWTCVLEDNADFPYPFVASEVLRLQRSGLWNDMANRSTLLYRAWAAGCDYAVNLDDDMLPSKALYSQLKAYLASEAQHGSAPRYCRVTLRELWGDVNHYRADGVWNHKQWLLWAKIPEKLELKSCAHRLHISPFSEPPMHSVRMGPEMVIYHFGCLTPERRQARVAKYKTEDAINQFQGIGYDYMLDETGIVLLETPAEDAAFMQEWIQHGNLDAATEAVERQIEEELTAVAQRS